MLLTESALSADEGLSRERASVSALQLQLVSAQAEIARLKDDLSSAEHSASESSAALLQAQADKKCAASPALTCCRSKGCGLNGRDDSSCMR